MAVEKLLAVLLVMHHTGGLLSTELESSIVGGHNAPANTWPWVVSIQVKDSLGNDNALCGGTILNKRWVLTAASCWTKKHDVAPKRSIVAVGRHNWNDVAKYRYPITEMTHSRYSVQGRMYINDIAILKLDKDIVFNGKAKIVTLPSAGQTFGPSSDCWIVGWGNVSMNVPLTKGTLQELNVPLVSQSECKAVYPNLPDNMLCAGDVQHGGKDACEGDYGGPLMCRTSGGFVQAGIMSNGNCGAPGRPGLYTDVTKYLDWINGYIQ